MKTAITVILASAVYGVAFLGTWQVSQRIDHGAATTPVVIWFVRLVIFVAIMFAVSLPLGILIRAL